MALSLWAVAATSFVSTAQIAVAANIAGEISESADNSWHSVIVVMQDQEESGDRPAVTAEEKIEHVEGLIDTAKNSQQNVLDQLAYETERNRAREVESLYVVNAVSATVTKEVALSLAKTPGVAEVKVDHKIAADPVIEDSGARLSSFGERSAAKHVPWNLQQIGVSEDLQGKYNGTGITVGIIDSGVDVSHPGLKAKWRGNTGDKSLSWFDPVGNSPDPVDSSGHGTHVIGTILGSDPNEASLIGIAPNANFIAARVFDQNGETNDTRLLKAMQWMLAPVDRNGKAHPELAPRIVNNSWGTSSTNELLRDALKQWRDAGILPVFSAGNVGENTPGGKGSITQPASFPEAFAVGALRSDDLVAKFSLRGPSRFTSNPKPDIVAPGVNIRSSHLQHKMKILSGTSMAAPHVTGVAALVLSANPKLKLTELEEILKNSATALTDLTHVDTPNHAYGVGKVNAALAVEMALPGQKIGSIQGNVYVRGVDADAPKIAHSPVRVFYQATTTDLTARVTDDSGNENVTLKIMNKANGSRSHAMKLIAGNKISGTYEFVISPQTLQGDDAAYQICAVDRTKKEACTQEYAFEQKSAVQIGWKEDFEAGTDGFEMGGETPMWMWGKPADSLKPAASGEKIVAVGLDGNGYKGMKDSVLITPPISLGKTDRAALSFKHWFDLDNYEYATYDTAEVWIGEVNGKTGEVTWEEKPQRVYKNRVADWERAQLDLLKYQGKTIRVMFGVRGVWKAEHDTSGWFIDDIAVEKAQESKPSKIDNDLTIDKFPNGRTLISFLPLKDQNVSAYRLYRAHDNGTFAKVKELTGTEIQKYAIRFNDYPTPQKGTYTYYVTAVAGATESDPSETLQRTFTQGKEIKSFNFESDEQGWKSEPDSKNNVFERGVPNVPDAQNNGKAPMSTQMAGKNPDSPNVFATVLNDYRKSKSTYTLISPEMDLSGYTDVTMYWQQWFNTRGRNGFDEWNSYDDDIAHVYVRSNGGAWKEIFTLDEKKIDEKDPADKKTQLRIGNAWHVDGVKLPQESLGKKTQVRFVLNTGSEITDFSGGWYIDDVIFADTADAQIPDPKPGTAQAHLAVQGGEDLPLPHLGALASVSSRMSAHDASVSDSWVPVREGTVELLERGAKVSTEAGSGAYLLRGSTGKVTVLAQAPGYKPASVVVELVDGEIVKRDFHLEQAKEQTITFTVKDHAGKSVPDARLTVYKKDDSKPVSTFEVEKAVTAKLLPGMYFVRVGAPGYLETNRSFEVLDGANSPLEIQLAAAVPHGAPKWIAYDSGNTDSALITMAAGKTAAVMFDAGKGDYVTSARFFVYRTSVAQDFEWTLWDADDIDGLPGKMLVGPVKAHVAAGSGGEWIEVAMPYPVAVNGSYYVSYTQLTDGKERISLGIDAKADGTDRSFKLINGAWGTPDEKGQFMINARVASFSAVVPAPSVNTDDLRTAVAAGAALQESDYTPETWQVFAAALANARDVLAAPQSQKEVTAAVTALRAAQTKLVKKPDPVAPVPGGAEKPVDPIVPAPGKEEQPVDPVAPVPGKEKKPDSAMETPENKEKADSLIPGKSAIVDKADQPGADQSAKDQNATEMKSSGAKARLSSTGATVSPLLAGALLVFLLGFTIVYLRKVNFAQVNNR
ncbi:S8 family serine peptidase [Arcanobacterium hippocoleae]